MNVNERGWRNSEWRSRYSSQGNRASQRRLAKVVAAERVGEAQLTMYQQLRGKEWSATAG
jgi:hypothetical protein